MENQSNIEIYTQNKNIYVSFKFENIFDENVKNLYNGFINNFKKNNITIYKSYISNYDYYVDVLVDKNFIYNFVNKIKIDASKINTRTKNFSCIWRDFDIYGNNIFLFNKQNGKFYYEYESIGD